VARPPHGAHAHQAPLLTLPEQNLFD